MRKGVQLIAYADRLAGDIAGISSLLDNELAGLFSGVHILPFFHPVDGSDAGFDPIDHTRVDRRLGGWRQISELAADYCVMADLIVNHVSAESPQFADVRHQGRASQYWNLFLRKTDLFPDSEDESVIAEEVRRIYRPRPGRPFTTIRLDDGTQYDFWTTFSEKQLDINVEAPAGKAYLRSILEKFAAAGIREIRLDAAGYAIKRRGTSCFMLPETFDFIGALSAQACALGINTLVEIHSHYKTQIAIATQVDRVYDFALPPLVLHSLYTANAAALKRWLAIAPRNCVTVLDTHDGIGIIDIAREGELKGLLADGEVDELINKIHDKTADASRKASGHASSNLDVYQVNTTYYDALGRDDCDYLIARAIQFFAPGTPQVYYVGLLAGENDLDLVARTGVGRDINRHYYTSDEIREALKRPVVARLIDLILIRNRSDAFGGVFEIRQSPAHELVMRWDNGNAYAQLNVDLVKRQATIVYHQADASQRFVIDENSIAASGKQDGKALEALQ